VPGQAFWPLVVMMRVALAAAVVEVVDNVLDGVNRITNRSTALTQRHVHVIERRHC
jgi:hypothetical protein